MKKLWKTLQKLHDSGATRRRRKLKNFKPVEILSHAAEEIVELAFEPDNMEEFGDIIFHLANYAIKKGWSVDKIEKQILKKMSERIKRPNCEI